MTYPTLLSPWYVVVRTRYLDEGYEYWTTDGEGKDSWSSYPKQAMLFMSLLAAARVATADGIAEVRVIYSKESLEEFRMQKEK